MRHGDMAFEGHKNSEHEYGRLVVNDIGDGIISELFPIYRHKCDFDNQFWKYAAMLETIWRPIFARSIAASGNSSNKLIDDHMFSESVFVPCVEEQRAIGTLLHQIDRTITLHQRKCQCRSLCGYFSWEQRKLGELTTILSAARVHKDEWRAAGVPFYRSSDVMAAFNGTENERVFISQELFEKLSAQSGAPQKGDVMVTGGGSVGTPYIVPDNKPLYTKDAD